MITNIYTINDAVAEDSGPIFQAKNNGVAIRQYSDLIKSVDKRLINDYSLWCLGTYDSESMELVMNQPLEIDTSFVPIVLEEYAEKFGKEAMNVK